MGCQVVPLPDDQVAFQIGTYRPLTWHFSSRYPRPFFYPIATRSGHALTRIGHPGAPNHDHHRSIWFGHQDVGGVNFWEDGRSAAIRQKQWLLYDDRAEQAVMAVSLGWYAEPERELLQQQLVTIVRPDDAQGVLVELQSTLQPGAASPESITLGKTNFGMLGVRVARSISEYFGRGTLLNSEGARGEPAIFGHYARWVDYSGPVPDNDATAVEGLTYFDHPANPRSPAHWHVREDGWMGASLTRLEPLVIARDQPVVVRYLLHAHAGPIDVDFAHQVADAFARAPLYRVVASERKHIAFELRLDG